MTSLANWCDKHGFSALAAEAKKHAAPAPDEAERAAWEKQRASVWEKLLAIEPAHQQALKELGHAELEGKYVHRDG